MQLCHINKNLNLQQVLFVLLISISVLNYANGSHCDMLTVEDYENYAKEFLPKGLLDFIQRGTFNDETLNENTIALSKIKLLPRYLRNTGNRTTETTIFGKTFKMPIGIAPSGLHKRWHPEGENATIKAAAAAGTIYIASSASSILMEDLVHAAPENTEKWFQTYILDKVNITMDIIRRAEKAGFSALVITLDMPVSSLRYFNKKNDHKNAHAMVNWDKYGGLKQAGRRDTVTWEDLANLVASTKLPVIVKGIQTPEDAKLAYHHGAKGAIVSNHGGRQLDGAISAIESLERITREFSDAAEKGFDIYFDSGVRSGLDVFRALALGAKFVFVGRAPMWGLFHSGQQGIENVLEILRSQLDTYMAQTGCSTVASITRDLVSVKF